METELQYQAERLLSIAEEAMNPQENGLLDRGDLIRLVERFCVLTKMLLAHQSHDQNVTNELSKRLQRSMSPEGSMHPPN